MKIIFIRHGESISNVKGVFSSDKSAKNGLTHNGIVQIENTATTIKGNVVAVYVSPFLRTIESAEVFLSHRPEKLEYIIDDRIREIDYSNLNHKKPNEAVAVVAKRQITGDYEIRFGKTGENKREILTRFYSFLIDILNKYNDNDQIVIFSHGRAISILESDLAEVKKDVIKSVASNGNGEINRIYLNKIDRDLLIRILNRIAI